MLCSGVYDDLTKQLIPCSCGCQSALMSGILRVRSRPLCLMLRAPMLPTLLGSQLTGAMTTLPSKTAVLGYVRVYLP